MWKAQRKRGHDGWEGMKDFSVMEHALGCQEGAVCWVRGGEGMLFVGDEESQESGSSG